jgi:hypothetical protein
MNISPEQARTPAMVLIQGIEREIPTTTVRFWRRFRRISWLHAGRQGTYSPRLMWHSGSDLMFGGVGLLRVSFSTAEDNSARHFQEIASRQSLV